MTIPDVKKYDVVIVMGAALRKNGQASPALKRRVLHGVNLIKAGKAGYLLVTGGIGKYGPSEASVMKQLAVSWGIPPEKIIMDERGTTTFKNAKECIRIMKQYNWHTPVIVSDSYHIPRSLFAFRGLGIHADGNGTKQGRETNTSWKWWYFHMREIIAFFWYIILILLEKLSKSLR